MKRRKEEGERRKGRKHKVIVQQNRTDGLAQKNEEKGKKRAPEFRRSFCVNGLVFAL
jgi:hypothetical protein